MKPDLIKKILCGLGGVCIGVGIVALLFYVNFLREKVWIPSGPRPVPIELIGTATNFTGLLGCLCLCYD